MAKLDSGRMSDATRVKQVDDAHRQFETDLEEILGVPDNTDIDNPIFGANPETPGAAPINSDGSITGVPIFKSIAPLSGGGNGIGFEFDDGTTKKRLVLEGTSIKIFEYNSTTDAWDQICDLDNPTGGSGLLTALSDVDREPLALADAGKILQVNEDGDGFVLTAPGSIEGVTSFVDLDDVAIASIGSGDENKIVKVNSSGFLALDTAPTGVGEPWIMLLRAQATSPWGDEDQTITNAGKNPQHISAVDGWLNSWNWSYPVSGPGIVSDTNLLTDRVIGSDTYLNYYINLEAGVYRVSVWYEAPSFNTTGTREWRIYPVGATCVQTGAIFTDRHDPPRNFDPNISGNFSSAGGVHSLGSKDLIVSTGGTVTLQVRQDSGGAINGVRFFASIAKVK